MSEKNKTSHVQSAPIRQQPQNIRKEKPHSVKIDVEEEEEEDVKTAKRRSPVDKQPAVILRTKPNPTTKIIRPKPLPPKVRVKPKSPTPKVRTKPKTPPPKVRPKPKTPPRPPPPKVRPKPKTPPRPPPPKVRPKPKTPPKVRITKPKTPPKLITRLNPAIIRTDTKVVRRNPTPKRIRNPYEVRRKVPNPPDLGPDMVLVRHRIRYHPQSCCDALTLRLGICLSLEKAVMFVGILTFGVGMGLLTHHITLAYADKRFSTTEILNMLTRVVSSTCMVFMGMFGIVAGYNRSTGLLLAWFTFYVVTFVTVITDFGLAMYQDKFHLHQSKMMETWSIVQMVFDILYILFHVYIGLIHFSFYWRVKTCPETLNESGDEEISVGDRVYLKKRSSEGTRHKRRP